jgi:GNAT superfamily N-acetyltransferase
MNTNVLNRFHAPRGASQADDLVLLAGTFADFAALRGHHYRAARPATFTRIVALRDGRPTVVGRYLRRRGEPRPVAVLVESLPSLGCRLRDEATGGRYASIKPAGRRARALNAEVRCISRVIVQPQFRGLGLAVRLVKHALATATTPITEAIAAMGNVHPFFEKAGMAAYRSPRTEWDARLIAALRTAGVSELDLARVEETAARIESLPMPARRFLERELHRWHAKVMVSTAADLREQLRSARQWLLCDPVYYLKVRPLV